MAKPAVTAAASTPRKHAHYFKPTPFTEADIYRVGRIFGVDDPVIFQALKKILMPGLRGGGKPRAQDIQEAIDSLVRWQELEAEDAAAGAGGAR